MRLLRLIEAAIQAEVLRVSAQAQRLAMRAVWAAIALVFIAAAIACLHVAVVAKLAESMSLVQATLLVAAIDVVLAGILAAVAMRTRPSEAELTALAVRRQIWSGLERDLAVVSIATTVFDMVWRRK